jgi:cupin fold WbuC family metalloprotein
MMQFKRLNADDSSKSITYEVIGEMTSVDKTLLTHLKQYASCEPEKNIRFCFHSGNPSTLHIMLIFERRGLYYPPHIHAHRDEVHFVLEGALEIHVVGKEGSLLRSYLNESSRNCMSIINAGTAHLTQPYSDYVVYTEIKNGRNIGFRDEIIDLGHVTDSEKREYMLQLSSSLPRA